MYIALILLQDKFKDALLFISSSLELVEDSWTILITGDFNFPNICWDTLTLKAGVHGCRSSAENLLHLMEEHLLSQVIDRPTRVRENETANILDLIITNNTEVIREVSILPTKLSDHELVSVILSDGFKCQPSTVRPKQNVTTDQNSFNSLNFTKANYQKIKEELKEINWDTIKERCTSENFPDTFYKQVLSICAKYTPKKTICIQEKNFKIAKSLLTTTTTMKYL